VSENFLVSDVLKEKLSKDSFFNNGNEDDNRIEVCEINVSNNNVYLDIVYNGKIVKNITIDVISYDGITYYFNNSLIFKVVRYYENKQNNYKVCTIIIDENLFWRSISYEQI
jgi:YHS domain-containing protein